MWKQAVQYFNKHNTCSWMQSGCCDNQTCDLAVSSSSMCQLQYDASRRTMGGGLTYLKPV